MRSENEGLKWKIKEREAKTVKVHRTLHKQWKQCGKLRTAKKSLRR